MKNTTYGLSRNLSLHVISLLLSIIGAALAIRAAIYQEPFSLSSFAVGLGVGGSIWAYFVR